MVRIKRANGRWQDLDVGVAPPEPFTRTNGTKMTDEEIARVAQVDLKLGHTKATRAQVAKPRTHTPDEIWATVERLGTQIAAAEHLGIKQGSVSSGLKRYMAAHGLTGELPGKLTPEQRRKRGAGKAPVAPIQKAEPEPEETIVDSDFAPSVPAPSLDQAISSYTEIPRHWTSGVRELTNAQAALVMSALIPTATTWTALRVAEWLIPEMRRHGYELVVRLVNE